MATLFFLPSDTTADVSPTPSDWGHVNSGSSRKLLLAPNGSALANDAYAPDAGDHLVDIDAMFRQFVSDVLPAQSIAAGAIALAVRAFEAVATNNLFVAWKFYAVSVDGTSVLGTLVALHRDDVEVPATGTLTGRLDSVTSTLFTAAAPFRLVLEVGLGGLPTTSGSTDGHNGTMNFGCTASDGFVPNGATGVNYMPYLLLNDVNLKTSIFPASANLHPISEGIAA